MSGSSAAKLYDETCKAALKRLRKESGIACDNLVMLMSGSAAAKLHLETFKAALKRLRKESGISFLR